ncbi:DUF3427 domain-containing protein [Macrococcus equi]|uniref:DUF3427 domain-containing protein n=1 Tax=Macrococcus equi TaxID=3395462 RepID=UPI0039BDD0B2
MKILELNEVYTREEVSMIFNDHNNYSRGAGSWGLHGIVRLKDNPSNFVFFVTINNNIHKSIYDEQISNDGILTWHSQNSMTLDNARIQDFINHDSDKNNIHLFFRKSKKDNFTYMGKLAYITHDSTREKPVHFKWQIIDWENIKNKDFINGLNTINEKYADYNENTLELTKRPDIPKIKLKKSFFSKILDFPAINEQNKNLGNAGERLVIKYIKDDLIRKGKSELAEKVFHTAKFEGDGAGYDIKAYDEEGNVIYIEVKTTKSDISSPFYISANEIYFSKINSDKYFLYRIYKYDLSKNSGKLYILHGDMAENLTLTPTSFKALPNK